MKTYERPRYALLNQMNDKILAQISLQDIQLILSATPDNQKGFIYLYSPVQMKWLPITASPEAQSPFIFERGLKAPPIKPIQGPGPVQGPVQGPAPGPAQGYGNSTPQNPIQKGPSPMPTSPMPAVKSTTPQPVSAPQAGTQNPTSPPAAMADNLKHHKSENLIETVIVPIAPFNQTSASQESKNLSTLNEPSTGSQKKSQDSSSSSIGSPPVENLRNPAQTISNDVSELTPTPVFINKGPDTKDKNVQTPQTPTPPQSLEGNWTSMGDKKMSIEPTAMIGFKSMVTAFEFPKVQLDRNLNIKPSTPFICYLTYLNHMFKVEGFLLPEDNRNITFQFNEIYDFKHVKELFRILAKK